MNSTEDWETFYAKNKDEIERQREEDLRALRVLNGGRQTTFPVECTDISVSVRYLPDSREPHARTIYFSVSQKTLEEEKALAWIRFREAAWDLCQNGTVRDDHRAWLAQFLEALAFSESHGLGFDACDALGLSRDRGRPKDFHRNILVALDVELMLLLPTESGKKLRGTPATEKAREEVRKAWKITADTLKRARPVWPNAKHVAATLIADDGKVGIPIEDSISEHCRALRRMKSELPGKHGPR